MRLNKHFGLGNFIKTIILGLRADIEIYLDMQTVLSFKIDVRMYMMVKLSCPINSLLAQKSPARSLVRKGPGYEAHSCTIHPGRKPTELTVGG